MIKVVVFASNVVGDSSKSYEQFAKDFNLGNKELNEINKKIFILAKKGRYSKKEIIEKLSKYLGVSKKKVINSAMKCGNLIITDKKIIKLIGKLRKGHKVIIVSNTNALFASLNKEKEQYNKFDLAILSHKIKLIRPEIKFYKELLRKLKVNPEECLYIDRKEKMLIPARKIGMKTILFKGYKQLDKKSIV